jgi:hypothetical protein
MHSFLPAAHLTYSDDDAVYSDDDAVRYFLERESERRLYALHRHIAAVNHLQTRTIAVKVFLVNRFISQSCYTRCLDMGCIQYHLRIFVFHSHYFSTSACDLLTKLLYAFSIYRTCD